MAKQATSIDELAAEIAREKAPTLSIGSDLEIAQKIKDRLCRSGGIIFAEGTFWGFNKTHWSEIKEKNMRKLVYPYDGEAPAKGRPVRLGKSTINSIISELGVMIKDDEFFAEPAVGINTLSGFIKIKDDGTATLEPHSPNHRHRHVVRGGWEPGAAESPPPESLLGKLLNGVFLEDDDADEKKSLIAELIGAALLGYATRLKAQKAAILYGESANNGKSQIIRITEGLLPRDAISAIRPEKFDDERFVVGLAGKHLNVCGELSSGKAIAAETFKDAVTGDLMSGRNPYERACSFRPQALQLFACNLPPSFTGGVDAGVRRRLMAIPFNRRIPDDEVVADIGSLIVENEADLLLAFAVGGAVRLVKNQRYTIPASSDDAIKEWVLSGDPVAAWLAEAVEIVSGAEASNTKIRTAIAFKSFKTWAVTEGFKDQHLPSINSFTRRVKPKEGIDYKRDASFPYFLGMRIKDTDTAGLFI